MKFDISIGAQNILNKLNGAGYEAYCVGGCVRDLLRGTVPQDWDICTSALPEQVEDCFQGQRIIETGRKHGTVTVVDSGALFEVTTYRTDGVYSDGRRPDSVQFVSDLSDDLSRRDFTMNAIAMDGTGGIQDPCSGADDIKAGIIRCVGEPDKRLCEDGLRIMRALRFASALGFQMETATAESIHRNKHMLSQVAAERIHVELCKLLVGNGAGGILRQYIDVLRVFWPELGPLVGLEQHNLWNCFDVWEHTILSVAHAPNDLVLRLTMLLHDIGKPHCFVPDENGTGQFDGHAAYGAEQADEMLRRLKFTHVIRKQVVALVSNHDAALMPRSEIIRHWLNKLGEECFLQLLAVQCADNMAQRTELVSDRLEQLQEIRRKTDEVLAEKQCFRLRDLAVNGQDVMTAGVAPGPAVGAVLTALMNKVIGGELPNDRTALQNEIGQLRPGPSML